MHRHLLRNLGRLTIAGCLSLAALTTACSDDDGDDKAAPSTTKAAGESEWCDSSRAVLNLTGAEQVEGIRAAAEVAPENLQSDYAKIVEFLEYQEENPGDAVGLTERQQDVVQPVLAVADALEKECGITLELLG